MWPLSARNPIRILIPRGVVVAAAAAVAVVHQPMVDRRRLYHHRLRPRQLKSSRRNSLTQSLPPRTIPARPVAIGIMAGGAAGQRHSRMVQGITIAAMAAVAGAAAETMGVGGITSGVAMIGILLEVLAGEMLTCPCRHSSNGAIPGHSPRHLHLLRHRLSALICRSGLLLAPWASLKFLRCITSRAPHQTFLLLLITYRLQYPLQCLLLQQNINVICY